MQVGAVLGRPEEGARHGQTRPVAVRRLGDGEPGVMFAVQIAGIVALKYDGKNPIK